MGVETTLCLSANTFVGPDLVVYPKGIKLEEVKGSDILLAIEVALMSLDYDRGLKARLYAPHGVRELCVIDAAQRRTSIHSGPAGGRWLTVVERGPGEALTFLALPSFSVRLGPL